MTNQDEARRAMIDPDAWAVLNERRAALEGRRFALKFAGTCLAILGVLLAVHVGFSWLVAP